MSFSPDRLATGSERWVVAGFVAALAVLVLGIIARDYEPAKLSILFMLLAYGPLVVLHEAGHALASAAMGWTLLRVEIGQGRRILGFRVGRVPVDVRWLPAGGFVVPAPVRLRWPRLENAILYAAGPGIQILIGLGIAVVVGLEHLLSRSDSVAVIAAQSVAAVIAIQVFFSLVPLGISDTAHDGAPTDGLGLLRSLFLRPWDVQTLLARLWTARAQDEPSASARAEILRQGLVQHPDNPVLALLLADALSELGEVFEAREKRLRALESPALPRELELEIRSRLGLRPPA